MLHVTTCHFLRFTCVQASAAAAAAALQNQPGLHALQNIREPYFNPTLWSGGSPLCYVNADSVSGLTNMCPSRSKLMPEYTTGHIATDRPCRLPAAHKWPQSNRQLCNEIRRRQQHLGRMRSRHPWKPVRLPPRYEAAQWATRNQMEVHERRENRRMVISFTIGRVKNYHAVNIGGSTIARTERETFVLYLA